VVTTRADVVGRDEELEQLSRFVVAVEALPGVLILEGDAGIGKTTLWRAGILAAERSGFLVLHSTPSEAETQLGFAAAADLLAPVAEPALARLPDVQRRALAGALLLQSDDAAIDRRAVATAFLGALRELASDQPVLVAVDDAQWLDAESALLLSYTARRLTSETIGFLLARRVGEAESQLRLGEDVQHIGVEPLSLGALNGLIRERRGTPLPRPLLRQIHDVSGGNPFFALELASAVPETRPGANLADVALPTSLEPLVKARLGKLPHQTREVLAELAAMSDPASAEPDAEVIAPAIDAGVVRISPEGLEFTHPLLRAAAYARLTAGRRRQLHRRLAEAAADLEHRAHHLARSVEVPDEAVAALIEEGAERAKRRGAPAVAAELFDYAIRITQDEEARVRRTLRAAAAKVDAGDSDGARAALEALLAEVPQGHLRAEVLAALADDIGVPVDRGIEISREGLAQPGIGDAVRARLLLALSDTVFLKNDLRRSREHALDALAVAERAGDDALLARAASWNGNLATLTARGEPWPLFEQARRLERRLSDVDPWRAARHWHGVNLMWADRLSEARPLLEAEYERAAELGHDSARSALAFHLAQLECRAGDFDRAGRYAREGQELATLIDTEHLTGILLYAGALVAAHVGDPAARTLAEEAVAVGAEAGDVFFAIHDRVVLGFLEASLGNYAAVHEHLGDLPQLLAEMGVGEPGIFPFQGDEIEALVALGELDAAERLIESVEEQGRELARPRLLALAWRGRGMLDAVRGDTVKAADAFVRALAEHERLELPFERARTLLAQGSVQRRANQKRAARESLEQALAVFEELGASLWAERARVERGRIGGRAVARRGELTATERAIADLVAAGHTNDEVAAALSLSPRTVQWNLSKIYRKVGVRSRTELAAGLAGAKRAPER
jgi:DNA-binding CsgD family transcriptional regulator